MLTNKILFKTAALVNFFYLISLLRKLDIPHEVYVTLGWLCFTLLCFAFASGFTSRKVKK